MIFVTDDAKEDWWQIQDDRTIGPRPELVTEFMTVCKVPFYMYSSEQFVKYASDFLKKPLQPNMVEEIKRRIEERLRDSISTSPKATSSAPEKATSSHEKLSEPVAPEKATSAAEPVPVIAPKLDGTKTG